MKMKNYLIHRLLLLMCFSVFTLTAYAQKNVTGKVLDEQGEPLIGVNVMVKGTSVGTATDINGSYKLAAPANATTLIFSFISYKTKEIEIGSQTTINVSMELDMKTLDEVVVVGYGTQVKEEITGSVVSVSGADISSLPTQSFESALQGQAAGVQVITGSGVAGSGSVIRIRGIASVSAGSDPLYVIDGIPITNDPFLQGNGGAMNSNPLANINPNDIQSVEILKDASATAIYGSRGANGVILITTKRGKSGKPSFNFTSRIGISNPTAKANMMNTAEFLQVYKEAWENDGNVGVPSDLPGGLTWQEAQRNDTDWWDAVTRTGFKHQYDLSMSQGTEKLSTYVGVGYSKNESYLMGNSYERISGRVNVDYKLTDKLKVALSTSLSRSLNDRVDAGWSGGLGKAMSESLPYYPIYNEDGSYFVPNGNQIDNNPVMKMNLLDWNVTELRTINNLSLTYSPIKDLNLKIGGGYDYYDIKNDKFMPVELRPNDGNTLMERRPVQVSNYNVSFTADYTKKIGDDHTLKFLAGTEYQQSKTDRQEVDETDGVVTRDVVPAGDEWKFFSLFGRINYTFQGKYLFEAVGRSDGSSRFGPNNRFGFFPAVSAGWIISNEDFLKDNDLLTFLKVKASYGISGNANFPNNQWRGAYLPDDGNITYNGQGIIYPDIQANPDLQWEEAKNFNATIEAGFLNDRITTEVSFYNRDTEKVLMQLATQRSSGFSNTWANVGSILNQGLEWSLTTYNLVGDFKWNTILNINYNYNEVTSIGNFSPDAVGGGTNDTRIVVGSPVGTNFLVRFAGIDPETGAPVYLDKDGNTTYQWTPDDRVAVGDVLPDFMGGITNKFEYKGFDLNVLVSFVKGGDIFDSSSKRQLGVVTNWNMRTDLFDRWQQPGDNATYPRLTRQTQAYGSGTPWINTDLWLHDGSFIRLRNVSLGYKIPLALVEKFKLKSARVAVSATNLLTFTEFIGLDPEIARDFENSTDRNMSPNITYLTPPQEKTFNFSLNVSF